MKLLPGLLVVPLLTLAGVGCSHGTLSEAPTAPTVTPTITTLTVTPVGGGTMIEGVVTPITSSGGFPSTGATLGAFAQYSDGSGKYVPATWTSSDTNVIAIEGDSMVAKTRGTVTITASAEGKTDTETFVVHGSFAGTWAGTFIVEQCGAGGGSIDELICYPMNQGRTPGALAVGAVVPMTMQITKSGTAVTAIAQFGNLRGTLTGSDRGQNFFSLTGTLSSAATTMTIIEWNARVREDLMEGALAFEVRVAGVPSHAQVIARLGEVTRR
jgi:hypothetical protein